jgi:hypothetical protein
MKEDILKRAMFAMPLSKEAKNSGILAGFDLDEMDDMEEMPEPSEEMPQMSRTPQNPEILMNNLRGDMRSVDARYMELAQLVGEEAAMETPPEVLAMLQSQLGQQAAPQGIGALPQAQGMMPPQGGMPPGMEGSMPPFPQGGAEQAPPTPDGMPPMYAQAGAFVTPLTRMAQFGADKLGSMATQANVLGGQFLSRGLPQQFPAIFENIRGPGGRFTAEQTLKYPTLTEHLSKFVGPTATRVAERAGSMVPPALATAAGYVGASGAYKSLMGDSADPERAALLKAYEDAYYARMGDRSIPMPPLDNKTNDEIKADILQITSKAGTYAPAANRPPISAAALAQGRAPMTAPQPTANTYVRSMGAQEGEEAAYLASKAPSPAPVVAPVAPVVPAAAESKDELGDFIKQRLAPAESTKSRTERVKEFQKEYAPLYREILGDTQDDMYRNAMLMIADAGLRYASAPAKSGTTLVSRLAESVQGLPQGFMALMAQAKDRQIKVDTAVLSQAVNDVQEQDKVAQQLRMEVLKGDYRLLLEKLKNTGGGVLEDGGAGLVIEKTPKGSFVKFGVDPNNPTVQTAVKSRWTLSPTDNPFVVNRGDAPTAVETDKAERVKLTNTLRALDNSLSTLDNLKGTYAQAYGPGAWFSDKVNNLLVPVLPAAVVRPDVNLVDASTRISTGMNSIMKSIASANDAGRVAVQEQEWARETAKGISDPTRFFSDKELAAKQFNSMEAMLRNARQQVLTQLGYEGKDYVMSTPNTGTQSDPFVIPTDPNEQKRMFNFLGSTIGKIQDPRATVYIRMPNGSVQSFNPTQLQGLLK